MKIKLQPGRMNGQHTYCDKVTRYIIYWQLKKTQLITVILQSWNMYCENLRISLGI